MQAELISLRADHTPHLCSEPRLAVSRETHHLVFVAVFGEAEELRERSIENAERMRERDGASHFNLIALPHSPHHATEVTETVYGNDGGLFKGRCKERARQVRTVMLDE